MNEDKVKIHDIPTTCRSSFGGYDVDTYGDYTLGTLCCRTHDVSIKVHPLLNISAAAKMLEMECKKKIEDLER